MGVSLSTSRAQVQEPPEEESSRRKLSAVQAQPYQESQRADEKSRSRSRSIQLINIEEEPSPPQRTRKARDDRDPVVMNAALLEAVVKTQGVERIKRKAEKLQRKRILVSRRRC
jgi:hypothetical protein